MTTKYISFSEARKNLSQLWKKSTAENIKYIVLIHSKPAFEIIPAIDELDHFSSLGEKSFDFWEGAEDDIFMNCHAIR